VNDDTVWLVERRTPPPGEWEPVGVWVDRREADVWIAVNLDQLADGYRIVRIRILGNA
jgi:hypothetical protein